MKYKQPEGYEKMFNPTNNQRSEDNIPESYPWPTPVKETRAP